MIKKDNCICKIKSKYFDLRPSEIKVADFVLKNTKEVTKLSINSLSEKINVSQPTIVRFVKALGYQGYREFKDDIILDIGNNATLNDAGLLYGFNLNKEDKIEDIPKKTINKTLNILEETLSSISIDSFERAVKMIVVARRIDIYGVENSMGVISDLSNKLLYLGLDVRYHPDIYIQNISANSLQLGDLAIGISYSGTSKDTVDIMKRAKHSGANTLAITNFEESIISKYADEIIHCSNSKGHIYGNAIFSRTAQTVIVDMIYMGVILSDYDRFSKILDKNGEISNNKSY